MKVKVKPALMDLPIKTSESGFYSGFTKKVTITAKLLVGALILWAIVFPKRSSAFLSGINDFILASFGGWYVYAMAFFVILCLGLALWPASGRLKMGLPGDKPEFSNFSWFSMMFGAGIGIGMLTFATAEPMYHFAKNPATMQGLTQPSTLGNVRDAYIWSFTHWGFAAWAAYAIVGLSLGYFSYRRGLPLTIRSGLTPLFGRRHVRVSGPCGRRGGGGRHRAGRVADAWALASSNSSRACHASAWATGSTPRRPTAAGSSSTAGTVVALLVIMGASTLSALSGVGKGIKWLSNINMGLSFFLLAFFVGLRVHAVRPAGAVCGPLGLRGVDPRQPLHRLVEGRHAGG